jgi:hypothetical protein
MSKHTATARHSRRSADLAAHRRVDVAGIQDLVLATCDDHLEQLERFATEIVGQFQPAAQPPDTMGQRG